MDKELHQKGENISKIMKYCIVRKLHICLYETAFVFRRYRWIILISFTHKALLLAKHRNQPLVILHSNSNSSTKAQQDFILESPITLHHRWVHPVLMRLGVNSVLNRKYILIASVIKYKPTHAAAYKMSLVHWYAYNKYLSKRYIDRESVIKEAAKRKILVNCLSKSTKSSGMHFATSVQTQSLSGMNIESLK